MSDADTIRCSVAIRDVLEALELPPPDSAGKVPSWLRDETKPSVQVYENPGRDSWFDYGAGIGGDVIDLVKSYFGCSFLKAVRFLSGMVDEGLVVRKHVHTEKPVIDLYERFMEESRPLDDDAVLFIMKTWGGHALNALAHKKFDVRQANAALWIAHWGDVNESSAVVGVKVRAYTGQRFSLDGSTFTSELYTNVVDRMHGAAVITEGEPDTWTLTSVLNGHADVFGLPSGAGVWKDAWLGQLQGYRRIIVCLDNDEAGNRAAMNICVEPFKALDPYVGVFNVGHALPAKDISDAVRLHNFDPVKAWAL